MQENSKKHREKPAVGHPGRPHKTPAGPPISAHGRISGQAASEHGIAVQRSAPKCRTCKATLVWHGALGVPTRPVKVCCRCPFCLRPFCVPCGRSHAPCKTRSGR
jgi:hypothetical protein